LKHAKKRVPPWRVDELQFPGGRNPDIDLFKHEFIKNLIKKVGAPPEKGLDALQDDLRDVAYRVLSGSLTSPLGMADGPAKKTLDEREKWLIANAINPATRLVDALSDEAHMLSEWPEQFEVLVPDRSELLTQLERFKTFADTLLYQIREWKSDKEELPAFIHIELASDLTHVFRTHFPNLPPARDSYDRREKHLRSKYVRFIDLCVEQIFGDEVTVPGYRLDQIRDVEGLN
jgi:hypothetical protein